MGDGSCRGGHRGPLCLCNLALIAPWPRRNPCTAALPSKIPRAFRHSDRAEPWWEARYAGAASKFAPGTPRFRRGHAYQGYPTGKDPRLHRTGQRDVGL